MIFDIRIELGDLRANISRFDSEQKKILLNIVKEESKQGAKTMKRALPKGKGKERGNLKKSVKAKQIKPKLGATIVPRKPKGSHRHLYAYGTKERVNRKGANRGKMPENRQVFESVETETQRKFERRVRQEMLGLDVDL